MEDDE
jgi:hypothetical protein